MKKMIQIAFLLTAFSVFACGGADGHDHTDHAGVPHGEQHDEAPAAEGNQSQPETAKAPAVEGMDSVVEAYLVEAETLSSDNFDATNAGLLVTALDAVPGETKPDFHGAMLGAAKAYVASGDLADARIKFGALSGMMIEYVESHECGVALHKAHCPMAPKGIEGTWLQAGDDIHNPWYGSDMYSCGVLKY